MGNILVGVTQFKKMIVMSVAVYASETWRLKKQDRDRLIAFEMKCYRRILRIRWEQKMTNEEVRGKSAFCKVSVMLDGKL